jgi:hypothetical protein
VKRKAGFSLSVFVVFALAVVGCNSLLPAQTASTLPTSTANGAVAQKPTAALTVTLTPLPSQTLTGTKTPYPTITPIPTDTPIPSATPLGAGPTATPQYACELVDKYPDQWAAFKPHSTFEARWKVKNTGASMWLPGRVALEYISGVKMYVGEDKQDLIYETAPGSLLLVIVDMLAPKARGNYTTVWGLVERRTGIAFCSFTAKITVK